MSGYERLMRAIRRDYERLDWVIVGGESGARARPMNADWARAIRDDCRWAGAAFFLKQMGGRDKDKGGAIPDDLMVREFPGWQSIE